MLMGISLALLISTQSVMAGNLKAFDTELETAVKKLGVSDRLYFTYVGHSAVHVAWVYQGHAVGVDENSLMDRNPASRFKFRWIAWHEACHIKLRHRWDWTTTKEQREADHEAVRDCMWRNMGRKFPLWRGVLTTYYGGSW